MFFRSDIRANLSLHHDTEDDYPPYEIFKEIALQVLTATGYPEKSLNDAIIAMFSLVHGLASIVTMKNVTYDEKWEDKIENFRKERCMKRLSVSKVLIFYFAAYIAWKKKNIFITCVLHCLSNLYSTIAFISAVF